MKKTLAKLISTWLMLALLLIILSMVYPILKTKYVDGSRPDEISGDGVCEAGVCRVLAGGCDGASCGAFCNGVCGGEEAEARHDGDAGE